MHNSNNDDTEYNKINHHIRNMIVLDSNQIKYIQECQNYEQLKEIVQLYVLVFEYFIENEIIQSEYIIQNTNILQLYTTKLGCIKRKICMMNTFTNHEKNIIKCMSISELIHIITTFNDIVRYVHKYI